MANLLMVEENFITQEVIDAIEKVEGYGLFIPLYRGSKYKIRRDYSEIHTKNN